MASVSLQSRLTLNCKLSGRTEVRQRTYSGYSASTGFKEGRPLWGQFFICKIKNGG